MPSEGRSRRFPFTFRQVAGMVLLVLAVIFILENRVSTTVRFLVPRVSAPLWVALLASAVAGVIAGALLTSRHDRD